MILQPERQSDANCIISEYGILIDDAFQDLFLFSRRASPQAVNDPGKTFETFASEVDSDGKRVKTERACTAVILFAAISENDVISGEYEIQPGERNQQYEQKTTETEEKN